jgi:hypothetical protein
MLSVSLVSEMLRVVNENLSMRSTIYAQGNAMWLSVCDVVGVRDISKLCQLPRNNFQYIDKSSADYDDLRVCHVCNHFCIFTAVACECNQSR